jgi:transposase
MWEAFFAFHICIACLLPELGRRSIRQRAMWSFPVILLLPACQRRSHIVHARRKFHDIHVTHRSPTTTEALSRIGALYAIEEQVRGKPPDVRRSARQAQAMPILGDLKSWMEKMLRSLSAKSDTAGAIRYALSHWRALTHYVDDGLLEIDNSAAERALRTVSIGRKNYLFFGADSGGVRAASFYTLIGSAKLNGLDPSFYLRSVLARIAEHPINRITELLPWNLAATLQSAPAEAA